MLVHIALLRDLEAHLDKPLDHRDRVKRDLDLFLATVPVNGTSPLALYRLLFEDNIFPGTFDEALNLGLIECRGGAQEVIQLTTGGYERLVDLIH